MKIFHRVEIFWITDVKEIIYKLFARKESDLIYSINKDRYDIVMKNESIKIKK